MPRLDPTATGAHVAPVVLPVSNGKKTAGRKRAASPPAQAVRRPASPRASLEIERIPTATFAFLLATPDLDAAAAEKARFASWAADHPFSDWRKAWQAYRAEPTAAPAPPSDRIAAALAALEAL